MQVATLLACFASFSYLLNVRRRIYKICGLKSKVIGCTDKFAVVVAVDAAVSVQIQNRMGVKFRIRIVIGTPWLRKKLGQGIDKGALPVDGDFVGFEALLIVDSVVGSMPSAHYIPGIGVTASDGPPTVWVLWRIDTNTG
jgi:hypothetical protein